MRGAAATAPEATASSPVTARGTASEPTCLPACPPRPPPASATLTTPRGTAVACAACAACVPLVCMVPGRATAVALPLGGPRTNPPPPVPGGVPPLLRGTAVGRLPARGAAWTEPLVPALGRGTAVTALGRGTAVGWPLLLTPPPCTCSSASRCGGGSSRTGRCTACARSGVGAQRREHVTGWRATCTACDVRHAPGWAMLTVATAAVRKSGEGEARKITSGVSAHAVRSCQ